MNWYHCHASYLPNEIQFWADDCRNSACFAQACYTFASDTHFLGEVLYSPLISRKTATKARLLSASEPDSNSLFNPLPICTCISHYFLPNPDFKDTIMASGRRKCKYNPDVFCCVCGCVILLNSNRKPIDIYVFDIKYLNIFPTDCKLMQIALMLIHVDKSSFILHNKLNTFLLIFLN